MHAWRWMKSGAGKLEKFDRTHLGAMLGKRPRHWAAEVAAKVVPFSEVPDDWKPYVLHTLRMAAARLASRVRCAGRYDREKILAEVPPGLLPEVKKQIAKG
jgi:hypothetical protein